MALSVSLLVLLVALPGNAQLWAQLHGTPAGGHAIVRTDETAVAVLRPGGDGCTLFVNGAFQVNIRPPLPLQTRGVVS